MKRIALVAVGGLLLAFAVVVFGGGSILRAGLEKGAGAALGTETKVSGASLNLFGGSVKVSGVRIGNPPGFKTERAFEVDDVGVEASLSSLLSDTFVVERIEIRSPEVTIEASAHGTNLGALLDRLEGSGKPGSSDGGGAKKGGKKLRVGEVRITGAKVRLAQSLLGKTEASVPLGDITLRELGSGARKDETTLAQLLGQILGAIAVAAASAKEGIPRELSRLLDRETARATLDSIRKEAEGIGESLKKGVEDATKDLRDLLRPK